MADQSTAEIGTSTHAVIDRAPKNFLTPEEKRRVDATKNEMTGNRRDPLQAMEQRGFAEDRLQIGIKSNIAEGSERPKTGGGTEKLQDAAEAAVRRANIFLKEGFDSPNLTGDRAAIFRQVESSLSKLWPEANDILSKMSLHDRQEFVKDILRNPDYQDAIQSLLGQALSSEGTKKLPEELQNKKAEIEQKLKENIRLQSEQDKKEREAREQLQKEFETVGKRKGDFQVELETLQKNKEAERLEKEEKQKMRIDLIREQEEAKEKWELVLKGHLKVTDPAKVQEDYQTAKKNLADVDKRILEIDQHEARLSELEIRKSQLQEQIDTAGSEKDKLISEQGDLDVQKAEIATDTSLEEIKINSKEKEFLQGLEQVFGNATLEHMKQQLQKADAAQIQALDKLAKENGDAVAAEVSKKLQTRWSDTKKGFLGREKHPLKKDQINSDFKYLMDKDPDELIKLMFSQDADKVTPEHKQEILEGLVRKKIEATGLSQGEARRIFDSTWGTGLIDSAIAKNAKFSESIDKLKAASGFSGSTREFINKNKYKWGGAILLGALLGYIGPLTAITGLAAASKAAMMR